MKVCLPILILLFIAGPCISENKKVDSLKIILKKEKDDIRRIDLMNEIALQYVNTAEQDSVMKYANEAMALSEKKQYGKGIAECHKRIAVVFFDKNDYDNALKHYTESYNYYSKTRDYLNIALLQTSIGNVYQNKNQLEKALEYFLNSIKILDSLAITDKDNIDIARAKGSNLNNIGNVHYFLGDYKKTEEYYKQSMQIYLDINDKVNLANSYSNLGMIARVQKDLVKSIEYRKKALAVFTESGNKEGMAYCNLGLGNTFYEMKNLSKTLFHFNEALSLYNEMGSKKGALMIYLNLGEIFASSDQYKESINSIEKAEQLAKEINSNEYLKDVYWAFTNVYKLMGDYRKALDYSLLFTGIKDSLFNTQSRQMLAEMQTRYETEKKEKENELLKKESRLQQLEIAKKEAEALQQKILLIASISFAVILAGFLFFVLRLFIQKKKANILLKRRNHEVSLQKEEIQSQRDEIITQRDMLSQQKGHIEFIHKEITDSIHYARRIQQAILPPSYYIQQIVKDHFILYKPKDVVSGDFYFFDKVDDKLIFGAVDCTGHGVPGAMMSVIGYNWIVQAVREKIIVSPDKILSFLDAGVNNTLRQTSGESGVKDSMDLAICTVNFSTSEVQYAGAYNSMYYTQNNQIIEIKADKKPIGVNEDGVTDTFTNNIVQLTPGDMVYLFSDGYPDQFGGPKGKKFKYKPLTDILLKIHKEPLHRQREVLDKTLVNWQGDLEQVDDILVIGVRIPEPPK